AAIGFMVTSYVGLTSSLTPAPTFTIPSAHTSPLHAEVRVSFGESREEVLQPAILERVEPCEASIVAPHPPFMRRRLVVANDHPSPAINELVQLQVVIDVRSDAAEGIRYSVLPNSHPRSVVAAAPHEPDAVFDIGVCGHSRDQILVVEHRPCRP